MATDTSATSNRDATMKVASELLQQALKLPNDVHVVGCHWENRSLITGSTFYPGYVVLHLQAFSDDTFPSQEVRAVFKSFDYRGEFTEAVFVRWEAVS